MTNEREIMTEEKPPKVRRGYHWKRHCSGWTMIKDVYVEEDGIRKRRQLYVGHLGREAFGELKRHHKGAQLEKAIQQWIADHDN
jgi:hypothetical protein